MRRNNRQSEAVCARDAADMVARLGEKGPEKNSRGMPANVR
jgi:hypothetical protein